MSYAKDALSVESSPTFGLFMLRPRLAGGLLLPKLSLYPNSDLSTEGKQRTFRLFGLLLKPKQWRFYAA
jgi:hypothetical protein